MRVIHSIHRYSQRERKKEAKKERENNGGYYTLIFLKNGLDNGVHLRFQKSQVDTFFYA